MEEEGRVWRRRVGGRRGWRRAVCRRRRDQLIGGGVLVTD